ncbi:hypothetical protein pdam_00005519, partial [Pocillopora damicornis]
AHDFKRAEITQKRTRRIFGTGRSHERSTYERTYLSEPIENHIIPNELSNLNLDKKHLQKRHRIFRRDLEPSRIPVRTLLRLRNKSRKLRNIILNPLRQYIKVLIKLKSRSRRSCSLFSGNMVVCLYKSQTHVANYCKFKLSTDIEKNPGLRLVYVDHIAHIAC